MSEAPVRATIIADASYCHTTKAGGYGTWISMDGGKRVQRSGVIQGSPENSTEAELKAVMIGIWYAYKLGATQLLVQTDCMTVIDVLRNKPHAAQAWLRKIFYAAKAEHFPHCQISARHVKGHTNVKDARSHVNRWCDHHAGIAMRQERKRRHGTSKARPKRKNSDSERFKAAMLAIPAPNPKEA